MIHGFRPQSLVLKKFVSRNVSRLALEELLLVRRGKAHAKRLGILLPIVGANQFDIANDNNVLPKGVGGRIELFDWPRPKHGAFESQPGVNRRVVARGEVVRDAAVIVTSFRDKRLIERTHVTLGEEGSVFRVQRKYLRK